MDQSEFLNLRAGIGTLTYCFDHSEIPAHSMFTLEHVYMRPEVNSNRFEISLRGKISLRCEVTSLSVFT